MVEAGQNWRDGVVMMFMPMAFPDLMINVCGQADKVVQVVWEPSSSKFIFELLLS